MRRSWVRYHTCRSCRELTTNALTGLVDYVADHTQTAYERALLLAAEIAKSAPLALRAAKAAISRSLEFSLDDALDYERSCYEPLLKTQDRTEALDAFREKRAPVFVGK